jgi:Mg-chelatase subunit ChlD
VPSLPGRSSLAPTQVHITENGKAVSNPIVRPIADGLTVAVQQLANAKIAAGAVVLLSDGASQGATPVPGHRVTATEVGAAAATAHAQIYTVGCSIAHTRRRV